MLAFAAAFLVVDRPFNLSVRQSFYQTFWAKHTTGMIENQAQSVEKRSIGAMPTRDHNDCPYVPPQRCVHYNATLTTVRAKTGTFLFNNFSHPTARPLASRQIDLSAHGSTGLPSIDI